MEQFLKEELLKKINDDNDDNEKYYSFYYSENNNKDALTNEWLDNQTSFIYKVSVMVAIDNNKCDFAHVVIGVQRSEKSQPELKGYFYFSGGENDDMGRVIDRAFKLLQHIHPAFEPR